MTTDNISLEQIQEVIEQAELIHSSEKVEHAIDEMAKQIVQHLHNCNPIVMPIMMGGLVLAGKLLPRLNFPLQLDYIHATRYRGETSGSELKWIKQPTNNIKDKTVLLIDDILDEGITLHAIIKFCEEQGAEKVLTAVLAEKTLEQSKPIPHADFTGLTVPDRYVFGYGMDYHEYLRNLPGIYALKEEIS